MIKENFAIRERLKSEGMLQSSKVIYSLWDGYLKNDSFWSDNKVPLVKIHCSGHAYKQDLIKLVEAMKPRRVIPNHTFHPDQFEGLFGEQALLLEDGQVIEL